MRIDEAKDFATSRNLIFIETFVPRFINIDVALDTLLKAYVPMTLNDQVRRATATTNPLHEQTQETVEATFKVVIIGDENMESIKKGIMTTLTSSKIEFGTRLIHHDRKIIKAILLNTSGQERNRNSVSICSRDAAVALLVFNVRERTTFERCKIWVERLRLINSHIAVILIAVDTDTSDIKM